MVRWLCIALVLSGCHLLAGLEELEPVSAKVEGTYRYRSVENDPTGMPLTVEEVLPAGSVDIDAILDDGTPSEVTYLDDGSFSFPVKYEGQRYRLLIALSSTLDEVQHDAPRIAIASHTAGRREPRPATVPTFVQFNFPLTGGSAYVMSTGVYTLSNTNQLGPTVNFDWRLSASLGGALGLLDAAEYDRLYAFQYESLTDTPTAWSRIRSVSSASVTQANNTTAMLPEPSAVVPNTCMQLVTTGADEALRIKSAHPRDYFAETADWHAFASPAPDHVGIAGSPFIANAGYVTALNLDITRAFHDPLPGTTLVAAAAVAQFFYTQLPGAMSAPQVNVTRRFVRAERGDATCAMSPTPLVYGVGLAGTFELDGTELDFDSKEFRRSGGVPVLTWSLVADGPVDSVTIQLWELQAINGVTTFVLRWGALVHGTQAFIDPDQLVVGRTYMIAVVTTLGRPGAASGDMATIALPIETATMWSHSFVVRE